MVPKQNPDKVYKDITVKGIDTALWGRVRIAVLKRGTNIPKWISQAIRERLHRENG